MPGSDVERAIALFNAMRSGVPQFARFRERLLDAQGKLLELWGSWVVGDTVDDGPAAHRADGVPACQAALRRVARGASGRQYLDAVAAGRDRGRVALLRRAADDLGALRHGEVADLYYFVRALGDQLRIAANLERAPRGGRPGGWRWQRLLESPGIAAYSHDKLAHLLGVSVGLVKFHRRKLPPRK